VSLEALNSSLLDVWLDARRRGTPVPFCGEDNLRSMAVVEKAIGSLQRRPARDLSGTPVPAGAFA
jgi:hypothetical protein